MIRRSAIIPAVAFLWLAMTPQAGAEELVTSISRHQVLVNSSFTGTSIVLFGTVEQDTAAARRRVGRYNLVVTVTGPKESVVVRQKERVLGIWTNTASRTFTNVPSYLAVMANRPADEFVNAELVRRLQLNLDNTILPQQIGPDLGDPGPADTFRQNLVRLKTQSELYLEKTNGVTLLTPTVFRADVPLPASAPIGSYDVDVKVFVDNNLIVRGNSAFEIVKVGFEQFVATAAKDYGLLYGLTTAMMALLTGWFASVVFRRD